MKGARSNGWLRGCGGLLPIADDPGNELILACHAVPFGMRLGWVSGHGDLEVRREAGVGQPDVHILKFQHAPGTGVLPLVKRFLCREQPCHQASPYLCGPGAHERGLGGRADGAPECGLHGHVVFQIDAYGADIFARAHDRHTGMPGVGD